QADAAYSRGLPRVFAGSPSGGPSVVLVRIALDFARQLVAVRVVQDLRAYLHRCAELRVELALVGEFVVAVGQRDLEYLALQRLEFLDVPRLKGDRAAKRLRVG